MIQITNQVAIVTGGSRGIGLAISTALVAEGVHVAITGRDEGQLSAVAAAASRRAGPGAVETFRADVARLRRHRNAWPRRRWPASAASTSSSTMRASAFFANVADMTPAQWSEVIDTNLTGVFNACHAAHPASSQARRRLHRQHQQPRREERVCGRRRLLCVEVRTERVQRGADAGSSLRQHPGQLRDAGVGRDRLLRRRRSRAAPTGRSRPRTSRKSWSTCCVRIRAACRAASKSGPRGRRSECEPQTCTVFDKHRDTLEQHETMMGSARGRLAVALDLLTDSLALVGQHGVYCRSERFPGQAEDGHRARARAAGRRQAARAERDGGTARGQEPCAVQRLEGTSRFGLRALLLRRRQLSRAAPSGAVSCQRDRMISHSVPGTQNIAPRAPGHRARRPAARGRARSRSSSSRSTTSA